MTKVSKANMEQGKILWVDDEIASFKPHVMVLEGKGYHVTTASSGAEAIELMDGQPFDCVLLDEHMPGQTGLDCLPIMHRKAPNVPIVMITKSEEDGVMEDAIGEAIADYLLKPVQPRQVLASLTRVLGRKRLIEGRSVETYRASFAALTEKIDTADSWDEWQAIYQEWIDWERRLEGSDAESMRPMLTYQKEEANRLFIRFYAKNYPQWITSQDAPCDFSHQILDRYVSPLLHEGRKVVLLVIDNLRLDHWHDIQPFFTDSFRVKEQMVVSSMLPTATQYARNAMFAGMLPADIAKRYPDKWVKDVLDTKPGRNAHEALFFQDWASRKGLSKPAYGKLSNAQAEKQWVDQWHQVKGKSLVGLVVNFVDRISHAKTDQSIVKDLATDDRGFKALTYGWWKNSPLRHWVNALADEGYELIVTTDHGTLSVEKAIQVKGPKEISANMRYKVGRGLQFKDKEVPLAVKPESIGLPSVALGDQIIFAGGTDFFVYPNQFHRYAGQFAGSYQHGGMSMEELMIPLAHLVPKG